MHKLPIMHISLALKNGGFYYALIECIIMECSMVLGYARVSTDGQSLEAQMAALKAAGCGRIYAEKRSGATTDRKALAKLMRDASPGDTIVVTRLDRLARSTRDLLNLLAQLGKDSIGFKSLRENSIDTTTP